MRISLNSKE